jgi:iron(III) transport system substrate-binding protein
MAGTRLTRRRVLQGAAALAAAASVRPVRAAPEQGAITPELVAAARAEGKVSWYTSVDLPLAEKIARTFESKYPGIACRVERSGAERNFQRIGQEFASGIRSVDVVNSSDASHFIVWKRNGWLAAYLPDDVAKHYPPEHKDADGCFATWRAFFSPIGYNTKLVKPEDAPKSFADLLDPKWAGKIVKAHPSYSGTILTATYEMSRDLGWGYFEKLAKQRVMQVQSAADPPKKVALGERAVTVDGGEYVMLQMKEAGQPIEVVYPSEGAPLITGPNAIFKEAPNPKAARLLQSWMFTLEAQQLMSDVGALRSLHPLVKEKVGRKPFAEIKAMKDDPVAVEAKSDEIKATYSKYFKV